jgi:hypothetical protein
LKGRSGVVVLEIKLPEIMEDALGSFDAAALRLLKEFLDPVDASPPPPTIYHYTNDLGLRGILETGRLWLSDIFSLNDPSELRHGFSHLVKILKRRAETGPPESKMFADDFVTFLNEGLDKSAHYFVLSFSSDGDELGQWRAYADNGRGYALGFDGAALENAFTKKGGVPLPNWSTFNVNYDESALIAIHEQMIESLWHLISLPRDVSVPREAINPYMKALSIKLALNALSAALFFKHKGYKNEKEFRFLQIFRADETSPELRQRFRSYEVVKYREFEWKLGGPDVLKQIIVGPSTDRSKGKRFAEDCQAAFNCGRVPVVHSEIPYRAL